MKGFESVSYYGMWIGVLLVWTLIGAVMLQIAISVYNSLAGGELSPGAVQSPSFGQSTLMILGATLLLLFAGKIIAAVAPESLGLSRPKAQLSYNSYQAANPPRPPQPDPLRRAAKLYLWFGAAFLVVSEMFAGMLSTTVARASVVIACFVIASSIPCAVLATVIPIVMEAIK